MSSLRVLLFFCLGFRLLHVQAALGQPTANSDAIKASLSSCQVLRKILDTPSKVQVPIRADDEHTAAGQACDQLEKVTSGTRGMELFDRLPDLAKRAFNAGEIEKAKAYSTQLLQMAPEYPKSWNYGNAIFYGNFVLGEISLQQGNVAQASQYLLASGATPGSPTLVSFGPNMTLAKELLEKGQSDVVLQYLALCKNFWKADRGKLDEWSATVRSGGIPDFTSNLYQ